MKKEKIYFVLLFATILVCVLVLLSHFVFTAHYPIQVIYQYPPEKTVEQVVEQREYSEEQLSSEPEQLVMVEEGSTVEEIPLVSFPLELNSCSKEELMLIPKIGAVTAQRILEYRDTLGGYSDISQLLTIKGIGEQTYQTITAYVYITGDDWDIART